MGQSTTKAMKFFASFDEQERKDLEYGDQQAWCQRSVKSPEPRFEDASVTRTWTPDED